MRIHGARLKRGPIGVAVSSESGGRIDAPITPVGVAIAGIETGDFAIASDGTVYSDLAVSFREGCHQAGCIKR